MAAGYLGKPGTELGPCLKPCIHRDCQHSRLIAAHPCAICNKPIGYETAYYIDDGTPNHAACLEMEIEREKEKTAP
jgi:hypothetical protein